MALVLTDLPAWVRQGTREQPGVLNATPLPSVPVVVQAQPEMVSSQGG